MTSAGIPYGNYNREVVDFLNKNTEAKVVVTGYANKVQAMTSSTTASLPSEQQLWLGC